MTWKHLVASLVMIPFVIAACILAVIAVASHFLLEGIETIGQDLTNWTERP